MADTLTFGPQWLRALSDGNAVTSPPPSPGITTKYKLAEFRYGREEMLALFDPKSRIPDKVKEHPSLVLEKPAVPLALQPATEDEQRLLAQSVNSTVVLRMMGRGGGSGPVTRGGRGGIDRGRGRGRGRGEVYFTRGMSYEDDGFGRGRHGRGESWDDGRDKRFDNGFGTRPYDEGAGGTTSPRKELSRSLSSENWRESRKEESADDEGDWRRAGPRDKWGARASWRDHRDYPERGGYSGYKPPAGFESRERYRSGRGSGSWDEENDPDNLPDWCADNEDLENIGTFDSSGAFMSLKEAEAIESKSPGPQRSKKSKEGEDVKDAGSKSAAVPDPSKDKPEKQSKAQKTETLQSSRSHSNSPAPESSPSPKPPESQRASPPHIEAVKQAEQRRSQTPPSQTQNKSSQIKQPAPTNAQPKTAKTQKNSTPAQPKDKQKAPPAVVKEESLDDQFDHLEKAAEDLVATWTAEEDEKDSKPPPDTESMNRWYYQDPQGDVQGPFASQEMAEWFSAGYFTMTLQVKRGCDEKFQPLGELIKRWGRVPFIPGPQAPPPFKGGSAAAPVTAPTPVPAAPSPPVSTSVAAGLPLPGAAAPLMMPQDPMKLLQQQQQLFMQQQMFLRQQLQMQQMATLLQSQESYQKLTPAQQQTMILQMLLQQNAMVPKPGQQPAGTAAAGGLSGSAAQHTAAQQSPQSISPRPEEASGGPPAFHRSLSQPGDNSAQGFHRTMSTPAMDEGNSIWGASKPTVPTSSAAQSWSQPGSVWDLEPTKNVRSLEELQRQQEMEKRQREEREAREAEERRRREEELRRQKEEEEQKLREEQQRAIKRQQESERQRLEEIRRREEEERKLEMERQKEQQMIEQQLRREQELARQREEERRRREEEEARRRREEEETRRREEEERKRREAQEELERKRQEEISRRQKAEDLRRQQEALRRIQQEQLANMQLPSSAQWAQSNSNGSGLPNSTGSTLSLAEIQSIEAEKQRKEELEKQQRLELQRQQLQAIQQQQQQQSKSWVQQKAGKSRQPISLLEIQQEQASQLDPEKRVSQPKVTPTVPLATATVWGSGAGATTPSSNWATEGAWGRQAQGFWEDAPINNKKNTVANNVSGFPALSQGSNNNNRPAPQKNKAAKSKKDEEAVQRLFQSMKPKDEFTQWCENSLKDMQTSVDIPTFIGFLQDVESPFEVTDYIRSYLGETKETNLFAKQFIERRSKYKNHLKLGQNARQKEGGLWSSNSQMGAQDQPTSDAFEESRASKKKKKRMQKVDPTILGFTVHGAPDRFNAGGIDNGTNSSTT